MTAKIQINETLTYKQVGELFSFLEQWYPKAYGYTVHNVGKTPTMAGIQTYAIFANRETSFNIENAIAIVKYHN